MTVSYIAVGFVVALVAALVFPQNAQLIGQIGGTLMLVIGAPLFGLIGFLRHR